MIGNVWEWTSDPYHPERGQVPVEQGLGANAGHDPRQPGVSVSVIKGGSFLCADNFCRRYRLAARHPQERVLATQESRRQTCLGCGTA
jgi:formylglycine-generating enzyme required for sulfatase activity